MFGIRASRVVSIGGLVTVLACGLPAVGQAAVVTFGSGLGAPASAAIAQPVDTAFWSTALSGGAQVSSPAAGQVLAVRVRGCAKRGSGGQLPLTQFHFQVLAPGGGASATVKVTSGPSNLPVCGGAVSGATVSTFHPVNLCVASGDDVAFNDEGGSSPAGFPHGVQYEVFAREPGAATSSFTSGGGANNGAHLRGSAHSGLELLMQMQLGTGRNASPLCG